MMVDAEMDLEEQSETRTTAAAPAKSELQLEQRQLTACRWGFLLLGAGILLQLFVPPFLPNRDPTRMPASVWYAIVVAVLLVPQLPATWLLWRMRRSPRWRLAAAALAACLLLDAALYLTLGMLRIPGTPWSQPEPVLHRLLEATCGMMSWFELWWMAVLFAEFALASRATRLVSRAELLGYAILGGGIATLVLNAWTFSTPSQRSEPEGFTLVLLAAEQLALFVTAIWSLYLASASATLARLLANKCDQALVDEQVR